MSFKDQTAAFFDELGHIRDAEQKVRESQEQQGGDGSGPYSNMLTQDETPADYRPTEFPEPNDPDVILRGLP